MHKVRILLASLVVGVGDVLRALGWLSVAFCATLGAFAALDAVADKREPAVTPLASGVVWRGGPSREALEAMDDAQLWEQCQSALEILDRVCPAVSEWARERFACGHLVFGKQKNCGWLGLWVPVLRQVSVHIDAISHGDIRLAATLAHEYRHSRQTAFDHMQATVYVLFSWEASPVIEPQAYAFGDRVRDAIIGQRR